MPNNLKPMLSPPWITYFNEIKSVIGEEDNLVTEVLFLPDTYTVEINVIGRTKAQSLATILNQTKNFGEIDVKVVVINQGEVISPLEKVFTPKEIVEVYNTALSTNNLYSSSSIRLLGDQPQVCAIFCKEVVQFFNDNLSDCFSNFNAVAAHVFIDILKPQLSGIEILSTTVNCVRE